MRITGLQDGKEDTRIKRQEATKSEMRKMAGLRGRTIPEQSPIPSVAPDVWKATMIAPG